MANVRRVFPPPEVGSAPYWETTYEVDFTNCGAAKDIDWRTAGNDASVALPGGSSSATWVAHSSSRTQAAIVAAAGVCKLEHGTGLHISPASGPNMWAADTSATKVLTQLSDLVPGMTVNDTVCIQLRANANKDPLVQHGTNNIAHFGLYLGRLSASQPNKDWAKNCTLLQDLTSTDLMVNHDQGDMGTVYPRDSGSGGGWSGSNADYYEAIVYPLSGSTAGNIKFMAGDWGGTFPAPDGTYAATTYHNLNRAVGFYTNSANLTYSPSTMYVGFFGAQLNLAFADVPLCTAYSLRVLKLVS